MISNLTIALIRVDRNLTLRWWQSLRRQR